MLAVYNNDLDEAVSGGMFVTGDFKRVLVAQLNGNREEDPTIDEEKVKKDAQDLYDVSECEIICQQRLYKS